MKKIMFNDRYGLTQAVLEGKKTMTRRVVPIDLYNQTDWKAVAEGDFEAVVDGEGYYHDIRKCGKYHIGEEVAIAQPYKNDDVLYYNAYKEDGTAREDGLQRHKEMLESPGYRNKMFVKADMMPHRIRITNIKVERLQDISDADILRESVEKVEDAGYTYRVSEQSGKFFACCDARMAFEYLIDKVSGRGTWESNPYVFAYEFELLR